MRKILESYEKVTEKLAPVNTVLYLVPVFETTLRKQRNPIQKQARSTRDFTPGMFLLSQIGLNSFPGAPSKKKFKPDI